MQRTRKDSRTISYLIAAVLGLSFATALFVDAWNDALDEAHREVAARTAALRLAVTRELRDTGAIFAAANALYDSHAGTDDGALSRYVVHLLDRSSAVTAAVIAPADPDAGIRVLTAAGDTRRAAAAAAAARELRKVLDAVHSNDAPVVSAAPADGPLAGSFLIANRLADGAALGVVVDPTVLLAAASSDGIAVTLAVDAPGLAGRTVVYERRDTNPGAGGWRLTDFSEESRVPLDGVSFRLVVGRTLRITDLDLGALLTATALGFGTTLLLVALAHAKETQARELRERNAVIEAQVQRQTRELAEARDQALQASRVKSDFLASMSHEIRTPLNAIIGMADLLSETRLDFDQEKYVSVFRKAGEALLSLVNDILDLSKIEAGQLELESIAFDPRELIEAAVEIYAHRGAEKGVELICLVAPAVPAMLVGDPARLRQVVLNLIGNAIKFTERGEIVVRMAPADEPEVPGRVLISVTDTGIGIPQDKQDAIFSSFTQVDSSTTRKYGGTGLGLAISRRLVEMMHGRIWVESELGRGSCFNVVVQCGVGDVTRGAVAQDLRGLRILAVDDIDTNRMVLQQTLSSLGAEVVLAQDAAVALHAFAQARDAGRAFDLVLTDYRMPGMDGFEFAGALAAAGGDVKTVVMLTSANLAQDISRARDMGLGGYLVKPIKRMDLLRAIHAVLAVPAQDVGAVARAPVGQQAQARILLVEDNADNRLLINAYLKNEPYRIDTAEHGAQAVEMFIADPYSLVLMDVQMPVMDGHEATRAIRAWEREAGRAPVPIIALTAHATREEMEKSLAAGCSSHLTKPIKKSVLLESIRQGLS